MEDFKSELTEKYPSIMGMEEINKSISDFLESLNCLYSVKAKLECINLLQGVFDKTLLNNPENVKTEIQQFINEFITVFTKLKKVYKYPPSN